MSKRWLLLALLLVAMLLPVWIGPYPPSFDYPNHLLEAQVAAHYTDPQFGYADYYQLNPGWYLRSNALSTLLLMGLGRLMPMTVAGQLVLSLYLALFLGGLALLLQRTGGFWPLLLLAPVLAYNFAFTSGWVNFIYGLAMSLYALVIYLRWQEHHRPRDLAWLAVLLLLMYSAHLLTWLLVEMILVTMLAVEPWQIRRHGLLFLALNSPLPLLFITRPLLAGAALLIAPVIWGGAALLQRWQMKVRTLASGAVGVTGVFIGVTKLSEPFYQELMPELQFSEFDKLTFPLRLFLLPHQYLPPQPLLVIYNLLLLGLMLTLAGLLIWQICFYQTTENKTRWLAALGMVVVVYFVSPSRTPDIWITEPRILLFIVFLGLAMVRWPAAGKLSKVIAAGAVSICLLSISGTTVYAYAYNQQAQAWNAQMAWLKPARSVLLLREKAGQYINRPTLLGTFNRFYTGEYFSIIYNLEYGGFASRTFNNGPVQPDPAIPIPAYNWPGFSDSNYVARHCPDLRAAYDAVLFWGQPGAGVAVQLDECFERGPGGANIAIWYDRTEP